MTTLPDIPSVGFRVGRDLISVALAANQTVLLIGDPGVGKSAIVYQAAQRLGMPLFVLLGATLDPTDIGGLPVRSQDGDRVVRLPLDEIHECSQRPGVLFLDEISAAPGPVQAALLRLILERKAGSVTLHPETRVVAACNPPEQAPAGFDLSAPLVGRMAVIKFRPEEKEVLDYLGRMGDDSDKATEADKALRDEGQLFEAVASVCPELLQIDIPQVCQQGGIPWAAPRSIERALRARAHALALGMDPDGDATYALMAGSIGERAAQTYAGIRRMIRDLPSIEEILADPVAARCPTDRMQQVAALSLVPRLAKANLWCAYIYAERLPQREFGAALAKLLHPLARFQPAFTDKWAQPGIKARAKLNARVQAPSEAVRVRGPAPAQESEADGN